MNGLWKFGLVFLGGLILGSVAKKAATCEGFRPVASNLLSKGMDAKECVMSKVEILKENVQDFVAEAQSASEKRKASNEQAKSTSKS